LNWLQKIAMPEYFQFMSYQFDVDKGNAIAADKTPVPLSPEELNQLRFSMIRVDSDHARTVDLSKPVLLATIAFDVGQLGVVLIDGYHRASRAIDDNVSMEGRVLTFEETLSCITDPSMVEDMQQIYKGAQ